MYVDENDRDTPMEVDAAPPPPPADGQTPGTVLGCSNTVCGIDDTLL